LGSIKLARVGNETHANYLRDLGYLLRERGEARKAAVSAGSEFERGRQFAYFEVLDLMQHQAEAFGLPLVDLALDGLDPRDLLRP
jgi:hypothetical protein